MSPDPLTKALATFPELVKDIDLDRLRAANIAEALVQGARLRKEAILAALRIGPATT